MRSHKEIYIKKNHSYLVITFTFFKTSEENFRGGQGGGEGI